MNVDQIRNSMKILLATISVFFQNCIFQLKRGYFMKNITGVDENRCFLIFCKIVFFHHMHLL